MTETKFSFNNNELCSAISDRFLVICLTKHVHVSHEYNKHESPFTLSRTLHFVYRHTKYSKELSSVAHLSCCLYDLPKVTEIPPIN